MRAYLLVLLLLAACAGAEEKPCTVGAMRCGTYFAPADSGLRPNDAGESAIEMCEADLPDSGHEWNPIEFCRCVEYADGGPTCQP